MKPEFLVLPLVAFGSLLFVRKFSVLFFAFLAVIGAFLAKGAAEPFGQLYLWLFDHVPGFMLFRDATKFYVLVAVSFTVLIPMIMSRIRFRLAPFLFVLIWLYTIRPAITHELTGTFQPSPVPEEFVALKDFLVLQDDSFATFWVPLRHRFGYASALHPAREGREVTKDELIQYGIRYVIVPPDPKETETADQFAANPWLRRLPQFRQIGVFKVL